MTTPFPNLYALLIGVDCYRPNRLPDGSMYRNLGGSVRDIEHIEAFLIDQQGVPAAQMRTGKNHLPNGERREWH